MIESEYIKKTDAMNIVKRTHGDYVAAWSEIRELPAVEIAKEKNWQLVGNGMEIRGCVETVNIQVLYCLHTEATGIRMLSKIQHFAIIVAQKWKMIKAEI